MIDRWDLRDIGDIGDIRDGALHRLASMWRVGI